MAKSKATVKAIAEVKKVEMPALVGLADPHHLAETFLTTQLRDDALTLIFHRQQWHRWDGSAFRVVDKTDVRYTLVAHIRRVFEQDARQNGRVVRQVSGNVTRNAMEALGSLCLLCAEREPPCWLSRRTLGGGRPMPSLSGANPPADPLAAEMLSTQGALVWLPGAVAGDPGCVRAPTPRFFTPVALDYPFRVDAGSPVQWLAFLNQLWPGDQESIDLLQEWMGYVVGGETRIHKILLLLGPKRSGKGTIQRILQAILGAHNGCNPTLSGLALPFGLEPLLGKTLAWISDARLSGRTDIIPAVERLLAISGEDSVTVDRKHLPAVTGRLGVRFVIASNEMPQLTDASGAMAGRFLVLQLIENWYGREDSKLQDRLLTERSEILLWALKGLGRLQARGRFVQPQAAAELVEEMLNLTSEISDFVADRCEINPQHTITRPELWIEWCDWCDENGIRKKGKQAELGKQLRAAFPRIKDAPRAWNGGKRGPRGYQGIGLNAATTAEREAKKQNAERTAEWLAYGKGETGD